MSEQINHDQLFKELLSTFFIEFIELFLPDVAGFLERDSITFLPQEYFTDLVSGDRKLLDIVAQVGFREQSAFFIIHVENQSYTESNFARRMFFYFAKLHQEYLLPVYPVVVFSFDEPQRAETTQYRVDFPQLKVLEFNFTTIQLNQMNWRDFLQQRNPVAAALMAKMKIQPEERPKVKAECLRLLATLKLDPARMRLISGFVDTYLRLDTREEAAFEVELDRMGLTEEERVMEIVTSWMEEGIRRGLHQGQQREVALVLRQLNRRLGTLRLDLRERISRLEIDRVEDLGEALLDFSSEAELIEWLDRLS
ncbi:DUF4351 domain-containing protein [Microcoleus sp. FACHB-831]|uniref:DUF4351 domain-containing protein n=1 Tax=Microcoleus sp. FACHB-831 TaxID=2692827 RepID=UPI001686B78C|nr:DUF4351 domain-containing protein [Microcoleus sp. FACHB-831]MBD1924239.1 DUF4351 domain-containing protein [Microcoleus sp. FACHB-831]